MLDDLVGFIIDEEYFLQTFNRPDSLVAVFFEEILTLFFVETMQWKIDHPEGKDRLGRNPFSM